MSENQTLGLPSPETSDGPRSETQDHSNSRGRSHGSIPTAEQCLKALHQLAGLVAMGLLKPGQANAMRGALRDILQHHQRAAGASQAGPIVEGRLLDLLPQNPTLMNLLEPFLTEEQIQTLMKSATDGKQQPET